MELQRQVEGAHYSGEQLGSKLAFIHESALSQSRYLDGQNFQTFHPNDLKFLFDQYDQQFFGDAVRPALGPTGIDFRISRRLTRSAGQTIRRRLGGQNHYEISVSSTLLFQTFHDVDRPILMSGVLCRNRLEALQRIVEHEMVHLAELLIWDDSSCANQRFQAISRNFFGHIGRHHQLVTQRERASKLFGVQPGHRVRFRFEGVEHVGVVNRITRRATVLVEDERGQRYTNGKRYQKFYIPVASLEPVDGI